MRHFYMDTNVFISQLKPDDPYYLEAKTIAENLEDDEIQAETSVLTLVETASVASRVYERKRGKRGSSKERQLFVIKALKRLVGLKIRFIHISGDSPMPIRDIQAKMPSIFNEAILLCLRTPLRTLDLMHLAAARHAKEMSRELGAFVTGDGEFLSRKEELSKILEIPIFSPREYVEGLGLKRKP